METDTLLTIIQLQQLYITSLNNIKNREFFLASEQLEEAYVLFDNIIDQITPTSPIRDFVIQLRDLIIDHLKQINQYIYAKEEINVDVTDLSTCEPTLYQSDIQLDDTSSYVSQRGIFDTNQRGIFDTSTGYNNDHDNDDNLVEQATRYIQSLMNDFFPCCRYKLKID